jgi:hypothetical protein
MGQKYIKKMNNGDFFTIISQSPFKFDRKQTLFTNLQIDTFAYFLKFFLHFALFYKNYPLHLQSVKDEKCG